MITKYSHVLPCFTTYEYITIFTHNWFYQVHGKMSNEGCKYMIRHWKIWEKLSILSTFNFRARHVKKKPLENATDGNFVLYITQYGNDKWRYESNSFFVANACKTMQYNFSSSIKKIVKIVELDIRYLFYILPFQSLLLKGK